MVQSTESYESLSMARTPNLSVPYLMLRVSIGMEDRLARRAAIVRGEDTTVYGIILTHAHIFCVIYPTPMLV